MTTVRDKRVIVTGGANGIGFRYCYNLLLNGAKVVAIFDLPGANGESSAKKLNEEFGKGRAISFLADVTKYKELEVVFQKAVKTLGGLDILINNAGVLDDALWEKQIDINFVVAIFDLPGANGESSAKKLNEEFGKGRAISFLADVTKYKELEVVFQKAVKVLGGLDILINNAGLLDDALWEKQIDINFTGLVKSTLLGYDIMGKHKGGNGGIIVNIASIVSLASVDYLPVYSATKHAVRAFSVSLKVHYEKTGISVRVMCPGVTDTPLIYDSKNKFLNFVDRDQAYKELSGYPRQSPDNVAKAMIQLIEKGVNGSVWVSQHDKPPVEVQLTEYETVKL